MTADSSGLLVREARPEEHERVGEVTFLGFGHGEPGARQPDPARLRLLRDAAARAEGGDLLVAADTTTGSILGTASLLRPDSALIRQSRDGEAELRLLAVLPEARRRGAGRLLMTEAIERARNWDSPALVLDTGPWNHRSQRLYHQLGFERLPERETVALPNGEHLAVFRYDYRAHDGVLIRLIRPAEHAQAAADLLSAYASAYRISEGYRAVILDVATRARDHEMWVAVDRANGELLGSVVTGRPGEQITRVGRAEDLDFRLLGVKPEARGRGIGRALTEHVISLGRLRGARRVVMNSGSEMRLAHRLYERLGFSLIEEEVRRREDGLLSLAFALDLGRG